MNFKKFNGSTWETVRHKRYGSGTESLTAFPAVIQASGDPLTDYTIYGNTGGVGDLDGDRYVIPVTSGGVTTNLYTDSPLGLTDTLTYTDTGIAIPTFDGDNTITFGTSVQPSGMSATFKGWHAVDAPKAYDGNDWS